MSSDFIVGFPGETEADFSDDARFGTRGAGSRARSRSSFRRVRSRRRSSSPTTCPKKREERSSRAAARSGRRTTARAPRDAGRNTARRCSSKARAQSAAIFSKAAPNETRSCTCPQLPSFATAHRSTRPHHSWAFRSPAQQTFAHRKVDASSVDSLPLYAAPKMKPASRALPILNA